MVSLYITVSIRRKTVGTEHHYLMHSCRNALTSYFARVLFMQDMIGDKSKGDTPQKLR